MFGEMFGERRAAFGGVRAEVETEKMNAEKAVEAADAFIDLLLAAVDLPEERKNELLLIRTGGRVSKAVQNITKISIDKKASPADIKNALGLLEMHAAALEGFYKDYAERRGE